MRCSCGSEANDQVLTPEGPHYGKVICQVCKRFLTWMPYPNKPINPDKLPKFNVGDPLPQLTGRSPRQIEFGANCRAAVLHRLRLALSSELYQAAHTITDSTFWIANKDRHAKELRWPHQWCE